MVWDGINGDYVQGDCVIQGGEGMEGREIMGLKQTVLPTPSQVDSLRILRMGWLQ